MSKKQRLGDLEHRFCSTDQPLSVARTPPVSFVASIQRNNHTIAARANNKQRRYEDKRKLRRYKRRWIVERTNAWLGQFRRLLVRHEHLLSTYYAFFYLACFWITLRRYS